jgi:myo-inositol-1(or 4)-monophosphatase
MYTKELTIARQAAQEAGKCLMNLLGNIHQVTKKGEIDLVTEADVRSEKAIIEVITGNFPDDSILAEETGKQENIRERTWIIDPLDGTTNFAHGFPFFAVSIGLQVEGEIVLGIVYNPCMKEHFEAVIGEGATLNREPIRVSEIRELDSSLLATGFPYSIREDSDTVIGLLKKIVVKAQGVRRAGAAAVDLCYVAAGRLDGFWEQGLKPWDTAAGSLIVREAGGKISDYNGNPYNPFQKNILASNPYIFDELASAINSKESSR